MSSQALLTAVYGFAASTADWNISFKMSEELAMKGIYHRLSRLQGDKRKAFTQVKAPLIQGGLTWLVTNFINKEKKISESRHSGNLSGRVPSNATYINNLQGAAGAQPVLQQYLTDNQLRESCCIFSERFPSRKDPSAQL